MSLTLTIAVSVVSGVVAGVFSGCLLGLWLARRPLPPRRRRGHEEVDPLVELRIREASARWAAQHGYPQAAGVVASKLRLLHRLSRRERGWRS
jgi:hypothetical protein